MTDPNRFGPRQAGFSSATAGAILKSTGTGTVADPIIQTVQLATGAVEIGKVQVLGDDGGAIIGSESDAAWDGAAAAPTWTALFKYAAVILGITSGAKVITDANGTIQQYLRGLVSQWVAGTLVLRGGATASGSAVANNPNTIGGRAATANPAAVADGQVVNAMFDKLGKLVAVGAIRTLKGTQKTTISNSTAETTIITQVASTFCDPYGMIFANSGASTTKVDIRDTTGGSIIATIEVPTLETRGFMLPVDSAIPQTTVNTNWTAQCTTATTALEVSTFYVKNI